MAGELREVVERQQARLEAAYGPQGRGATQQQGGSWATADGGGVQAAGCCVAPAQSASTCAALGCHAAQSPWRTIKWQAGEVGDRLATKVQAQPAVDNAIHCLLPPVGQVRLEAAARHASSCEGAAQP